MINPVPHRNDIYNGVKVIHLKSYVLELNKPNKFSSLTCISAKVNNFFLFQFLVDSISYLMYITYF